MGKFKLYINECKAEYVILQQEAKRDYFGILDGGI